MAEPVAERHPSRLSLTKTGKLWAQTSKKKNVGGGPGRAMGLGAENLPPAGPGPPGGGAGGGGGAVQGVYRAARAFRAAGGLAAAAAARPAAGEAGGGFGGAGELPGLPELLRACDAVGAEAVGLGRSAPGDGVIHRFRQSVGNSLKPSYMPIYSDPEMELGVFLLPAGCSLPLHDHPGMTVVSKVLTGHMQIRGLDWAAPQPAGWAPGAACPAREATLVRNELLGPDSPAVALTPNSGGNIHELYARSACAFLDVLVPPYTAAGCGYYDVMPNTLAREAELGSSAGLKLVQAPEDFYIDKVEYTGAPIVS